MIKKTIWFIVCCAYPFIAQAQQKNFSYKFYGFVRGDLFYNTRANVAPVDGNFYLYPHDQKFDSEGKDLNATPNGSFYTFTTRLGMDIAGPNLGSANTMAKIEADFGGFSASNTMLRIRQAYVNLDWGKHHVLIGQTWHPLFGSVSPDILNLSTGAPFQPFNREPQLRYQYTAGRIKLTTAALWQLQYLSNGPNGASEEYIKNSCIPEFYAGVDIQPQTNWLLGAGVHLISLKPRTASTWNERVYKVNERITAMSYELHTKYTRPGFTFAAKTVMASCLDHMAMLGGYGISAINPTNGQQEYTPYRHSTSWINITVGTTWKGHLFTGYTKNLGTPDALVSSTRYGAGLDMDQLLSINAAISYKLPHWQIGIEYSPTTSWYGNTVLSSGKVANTHRVTNHRILGLLMYNF